MDGSGDSCVLKPRSGRDRLVRLKSGSEHGRVATAPARSSIEEEKGEHLARALDTWCKQRFKIVNYGTTYDCCRDSILAKLPKVKGGSCYSALQCHRPR
jgi:hypothetical protein